MNNCDFNVSDLYNEEVTIDLKPGTAAFNKAGNSITGVLIGRMVEEKFNGNKPVAEVTGFIIHTFSKEIRIECSQISSIYRATYLA